MEEVDAIILHSLREIGCKIDDEAKLKTLTPEEIFKCLGKLCKCIKPDTELLSTHLPAQMAQRFAAASQLVDCCKSLGFNGDLGYQTILYSNPIELRRIFMWLIERIPKAEDKTDSFHPTGEVSRSKSIEDAIFRKLNVDLHRPWLLEFLQPARNAPADPVDLEKPDVRDNMSEGNDGMSFGILNERLSLQILKNTNESLSQRSSIKPETCIPPSLPRMIKIC